MELIAKSYKLRFIHPFGVSSNTRTETTSVFIRIENNGVYGYGEACLPHYLGENEIETLDFFAKCAVLLKNFDGTHSLPEILAGVDKLSDSNNAGKAAIDVALHDLYARNIGLPVYEMLGLPHAGPKATSFTIAIDTPARLQQKFIEADDYSILKIKAGTADDKKLIRQIRKFTYKPLYVDVNQGWRDKHMVLDMIGWMKDQGVVLVEQPMPVHMPDEMAWVTEKSPLPTIADESVKRLKDLSSIKDVFSGINIKLMKCTGIYEALRMIDEAKRMRMKIMLGCMAESSCAVAAMAQLVSQADYVDLDAPRLYLNDPFTGLQYTGGTIKAPASAGTGVRPPDHFFC